MTNGRLGMIVGVDGCDGTGKTTLADEIARQLRRRNETVELVHKGPPTRSVLEEYATDIESVEDVHLVLDRWHFGELVYPRLYRAQGDYGELGVAGFRWVEKFLQARGATIFVVDMPYATVAARLQSRGEDFLESRHVAEVLERFQQVATMSVLTGGMPILGTSHVELLPSLATYLVGEAEYRARMASPLRKFPSYVGGPRPGVLLVGEKRGGRPPFESRACFMPLKNKSGQFFWDCLPDPFWREVGVANAYEDDIGALWEELDKPQVVALGGKACTSLLKTGLLHAAVPHPQWVKRFAHTRGAEYGELIAKAAASGSEHLKWPS